MSRRVCLNKAETHGFVGEGFRSRVDRAGEAGVSSGARHEAAYDKEAQAETGQSGHLRNASIVEMPDTCVSEEEEEEGEGERYAGTSRVDDSSPEGSAAIHAN